MTPRTCTKEGCNKPHRAKGLCSTHDQARRRALPKCKVIGCNSGSTRKKAFYCRKHEHHAFAKQGPAKTAANLEKFRALITPDEKTGCWLWEPSQCNNDGYGLLHAAGVQWTAHRFAFVMFNGGQTRGTQLDHLCNNTRCVRPDHLEPVTDRVNSRRRNQRIKQFDRPHHEDSVTRPVMGTHLTTDGLRPPGGNLLIWAMFNGLPLTKPGIEMVRAQ